MIRKMFFLELIDSPNYKIGFSQLKKILFIDFFLKVKVQTIYNRLLFFILVIDLIRKKYSNV